MSEYLLQPPQSISVPIPNIGASTRAEQDDTALVTASQAGDQDAFALLVQRHQRRVLTWSIVCSSSMKRRTRSLRKPFSRHGRAYPLFAAMPDSLPGSIVSPTTVV